MRLVFGDVANAVRMVFFLLRFVRCLYCSYNWESVLDSFWNTCHRRILQIKIQAGKGNPYFELYTVHTLRKMKRKKKLDRGWAFNSYTHSTALLPINRWSTTKWMKKMHSIREYKLQHCSKWGSSILCIKWLFNDL